MVRFVCNAPGCKATAEKQKKLAKYPWMSGVTFHAFPTTRKNPKLRQLWVRMLRRESSWSPNYYSRVCSRHFVGGRGPTSTHPVPTLFAYNNYKKSQDRRSANIVKREQAMAFAFWKNSPARRLPVEDRLLENQDPDQDTVMHEMDSSLYDNFCGEITVGEAAPVKSSVSGR